MLTVYDITDPKFTDRHWQGYYDMVVEAHRKYGSLLTLTGWEIMKSTYLSYARMEKYFVRLVVFEGEKAVGWVILTVKNLNTPEQITYMAQDSLYEKIPVEFANALVPSLEKFMIKYNCKNLSLMSNCQRTSDFGLLLGGTIISRLDRFRLDRKGANHRLINNWLEEIPKNNPELNLLHCKEIPGKYYERFAILFTTFLNDMPKENPNPRPFCITEEDLRHQEKWRRENKHSMYISMLLDKSDNIIGFSKAPVNCESTEYIYQSMTGVISAYRGRGLSKWLKAALFKKLGEEYPENKYLTTDMRAVNKPIQRVNEQMGYKMVSRGHEIEISLENIKAFMAKT